MVGDPGFIPVSTPFYPLLHGGVERVVIGNMDDSLSCFTTGMGHVS